LPNPVQAQENTDTATGTEVEIAAKSGILIEPYIIDEKLKAKDLRKYTVKISNNSGRFANLYPIVQDVSQVAGDKVVDSIYDLDPEISLTRWITFSRGVIELKPGESLERDLEIQVGMNTPPGRYFASISFAPGSNRPQAEAALRNSEQAHMLINVEVEEVVVEQARIKTFKTGSNFYMQYPVTFRISVENSGNRDIAPKGNLFLYNRRGEEIEALPIDGLSLFTAPDGSTDLELEWNGGRNLGKIQARLELDYGANLTRDMQASYFFWVLPWPVLSMILGAMFLLVFLLTWILFRRSHRIHAHNQMFQKPYDPHDKGGGVLDLKGKK